MSKIVDRTIIIPKEVNLNYDQKMRKLSIDGPNGSLSLIVHPLVNLTIEDDKIQTSYFSINDKKSKALTGTTNSLIFNALKGSVSDYKKVVEMKGVGYKALLVNNEKLIISAGYSHDISLTIPNNLKIECLNGVKVIIKGSDKQKVGLFASKIRDIRRPNVFVKSLKGIFYEDEISNFKLKAGKRDSKK